MCWKRPRPHKGGRGRLPPDPNSTPSIRPAVQRPFLAWAKMFEPAAVFAVFARIEHWQPRA